MITWMIIAIAEVLVSASSITHTIMIPNGSGLWRSMARPWSWLGWGYSFPSPNRDLFSLASRGIQHPLGICVDSNGGPSGTRPNLSCQIFLYSDRSWVCLYVLPNSIRLSNFYHRRGG